MSRRVSFELNMDLAQTAGRELEWRQTESFHRAYQLTLDGQEVAALRFEKSCGSLATGQSPQGRWTFKRTGFLSPKVSVREAGSDSDIAVFTPSWGGGGWVAFRSGRRYHLRHKNFWATEWAFESEDGAPVVALAGPHGLFKHGGNASVSPAAAGLAESTVLLLLIWYVRVLMNEDAAAVTVCG